MKIRHIIHQNGKKINIFAVTTFNSLWNWTSSRLFHNVFWYDHIKKKPCAYNMKKAFKCIFNVRKKNHNETPPSRANFQRERAFQI